MTTNTPFHSYAYDPARDASRCEATIDPYHYGIGWDEPRCQCATGHTGAHVGRDRSGMNSGFTHAIRIRENVGCDRVDATPAPLAPLGATDSYTYANGVTAYYAGGTLAIHPSAMDAPAMVPCHLSPVIVATAMAMGLTRTEATLLAEACESYGVTR